MPDAITATPAIICFHGGGFISGAKENIPDREVLINLLSQGVAVISVEYPFLGQAHLTTNSIIPDLENHGYHTILEQTRLAIDFLSKHAENYNLDTERLILCGSSAGTIIAEYLSYGCDYNFAACIAFNQPYRIDDYSHYFQGPSQTPLFLFSGHDNLDEVHHPSFTEKMVELCRQKSIPVAHFGIKENDLPNLPEGQPFIPYAYAQIQASWGDR